MTRWGWVGPAIALLITGCTTATKPRPQPVPTTVLPRAVTPVATPTPAPIPEVPTVRPAAHTDPPLVRILLTRTNEAVELSQPDRAYRARWEGQEGWFWGPLSLRVVSSRAWQVAAFRDPASAEAVEEQLQKTLGLSVMTASVPSENGFFRVRVQWRSAEPSDPKAVLSGAGFPDAYPVLTGVSIRVDSANAASAEIAGPLVLEPQDGWPTSVAGGRYLGRLIFRVSQGQLLVINQLNLESYLRGVVPAEMGPAQFPQLDALKAQAVAARTYAVAHLGDHDDEGYDLCDTPACQVYRGFAAHHALTDRAVSETAGLIAVFEGEPIDAMYTSTCGGHTEDASLLFSGRAQPYLVGVPCAWDRPMMLAGTGSGERFPDAAAFRNHLAARALNLQPSATPQAIIDRVASLCNGRRASVGADPGAAEFTVGLMVAGGLEDVNALVDGAGAGSLAELADLFRIPLEVPPRGDVRIRGWHLRAALAVLELQGLVVRDSGEGVPHPDGVAIFPRRAERSEPLPSPVPLYWRWGSTYGLSSGLRVLPGTTLERYRLGRDLLALVVVQSEGGGEADRRSSWSSWSRDRSWEELARGLDLPDLDRLEVTRRGVSGRVIGLSAFGRSGTRKDLSGFPIRRALDLPENLFILHEMVGADGKRTVRFLGRGWGHGVGLCQNGSYGLARAGMTFDRILEHYYTGIQVVPWQPQTP